MMENDERDEQRMMQMDLQGSIELGMDTVSELVLDFYLGNDSKLALLNPSVQTFESTVCDTNKA